MQNSTIQHGISEKINFTQIHRLRGGLSMSHGADSLKSILFALGANFTIAISKMFGAVVTGSGSMMAETIHSLADCGNQLL